VLEFSQHVFYISHICHFLSEKNVSTVFKFVSIVWPSDVDIILSLLVTTIFKGVALHTAIFIIGWD
jgi:hypothetical protein